MIKAKVSYRKQIALHHLCHKNIETLESGPWDRGVASNTPLPRVIPCQMWPF